MFPLPHATVDDDRQFHKFHLMRIRDTRTENKPIDQRCGDGTGIHVSGCWATKHNPRLRGNPIPFPHRATSTPRFRPWSPHLILEGPTSTAICTQSVLPSPPSGVSWQADWPAAPFVWSVAAARVPAVTKEAINHIGQHIVLNSHHHLFHGFFVWSLDVSGSINTHIFICALYVSDFLSTILLHLSSHTLVWAHLHSRYLPLPQVENFDFIVHTAFDYELHICTAIIIAHRHGLICRDSSKVAHSHHNLIHCHDAPGYV